VGRPSRPGSVAAFFIVENYSRRAREDSPLAGQSIDDRLSRGVVRMFFCGEYRGEHPNILHLRGRAAINVWSRRGWFFCGEFRGGHAKILHLRCRAAIMVCCEAGMVFLWRISRRAREDSPLAGQGGDDCLLRIAAWQGGFFVANFGEGARCWAELGLNRKWC
jgi:hypothetical protein